MLKTVLTSTSVLAMPNFNVPFLVETDDCDVSGVAVLMQQGQPIAYLIKGMSIKHQSLLVYDKNLALVMVVTK